MLVDLFVDFRTAGPGTLLPIFERAEIMVCTSDSSSMLSEAIAVHLPVVGILPAAHGFKPQEGEYREMMREKNWARFISVDRADRRTVCRGAFGSEAAAREPPRPSGRPAQAEAAGALRVIEDRMQDGTDIRPKPLTGGGSSSSSL